MNKLPHEYNRRILLLVSGMSPQIVTETLYALTQVTKPAFVPTEVHLVSTQTGAEQARLDLLSGDRHFFNFCNDYAVDSTIFSINNIHIIHDANGHLLSDIRTPAENEASADFITRKIQELTSDTEAALHVSMAGGRKTMGYYAGYALSLFGRPQDRLSHVLVQEGYEGLRGFYYPTPKSHTIAGRNGSLDAAKAEVSLAEIPFVRMRDGLLSHIAEGRLGFNEAITLSQQAEAEPSLLIDIPRHTLVCQGIDVRLEKLEFAFYAWIVQRESPISGSEITEQGYHKIYAEEFLSTYQEIEGEMGVNDRTSEQLQNGMDKGFIDGKMSSINGKIERTLMSKRLASAYLFENLNKGKRGQSLYALRLENHQIEWKRK